MSSAKFIILGDMKQGTEALPTAVYFLKMARKDGNQSLNKTFFFGEIKIRVVLDPHAGDKVYIEPPDCGNIGVSGFLDTFRGKKTIPPTQRHLIEDQLVNEYRVPRSELAQISPAKLMCGVRPIRQGVSLINGIYGSGAPVNTIGVDGDLYVRTDSDQLYQKELDVWYEIIQDSGDPQLTTQLPVEATIPETLEDGTIRYTVATSLFKDTYEALLPTRFTGIMRRIMQVTFSTPSWRGFAPVGDRPEVSPVSYKFGDSWGCIKHNDGYFLIQITRDAVYSVPADLCVRQFKDVTSTVRDAITLKSANVARRVKIGEIPPGLGASWNQEIGWAFSYATPEAAIVYETRKFVGAEEFVATRLLTLTFGFDENNSLISAALDVTDPEVFWVNEYTNTRHQNSKGLFNIVADLGPELGGLQNISVDFGKQYATQNIAGYKANDIPVYVYYTEDGQKLCTYSYDVTESRADTLVAETFEVIEIQITNCAGGYSTVNYNEFTKVLEQPWVGSKTTASATTYGFSCAGSSIFQAEGAKSENYSAWTWRNKYADALALLNECWQYQVWYQAYDMYGEPTGEPYLIGPYGTFNTYYSGDLCMVGRDTVINSTSGAVVTCALTLSVLDRECVLITNSKYTGSETKTVNSRTYGYNTIGTTLYTELIDYGAQSGAEACYTHYKIAGWPLLGIPCYKLRGANTPYVSGKTVRPNRELITYLQLSTNPTAPWYYWNHALDGAVIGPGCWGETSNVITATQYAAYGGADTDITTNTAANSELTNKIYGHGEPIDMGNANAGIIYQLHPKVPMVFWFSQAAYSPSNYATHGAGMNSAAVVKINNTTYDVKNQLFGWIGVA